MLTVLEWQRRLFLPVLLAVTLWTQVAVAADYKPLAVVDSQRIVEEYEAAKDAKQQWQKFVGDIEKEIGDKQRELQRLQEDFESQQMLLGDEARASRLQDLERAKNEYFRFREQADVRVQQEYQDKIGPIIDQVQTIAERIGKEDGYGIVIDSAAFTILYLDSDVDLTNRVLEALARGDED